VAVNTPDAFAWPEGKRAALSLSFDDARLSQADVGLPVLDRHGVRGTFYVTLRSVLERLDTWRAAVAAGHEIGNHSLRHACSGNFEFARQNPLEAYTLERMERELLEASDQIEQTLGVRPLTFAYPCGQTFVGRGESLKSYVPVVARHFVVGRRAFDEVHNHPVYCDLARATSLDLDCASLDEAMAMIERAAADGGWVIFMSHDVGEGGRQTTLTGVLDEVCRYATDPENGIWIDTVAAIGSYVRDARADSL
jgi:peptidoglycan/xylan/chitin deacetylase (PgdA/CDA1 family)